MSAARETVHENSTLKLSSRIPCAAMLSMLGVGTPRTDPYAPISPHPTLSANMSTTFGLAAVERCPSASVVGNDAASASNSEGIRKERRIIDGLTRSVVDVEHSTASERRRTGA
jgi:hypothetical protein